MKKRTGVAVATLIMFGCGPSSDYLTNGNFPVVEGTQASVLGPGDIFVVRVFREKDLSGDFQVAGDGTVDYPLLGTLHVGGKTPSEVGKMIRDGLSHGFVKNPFVSVVVKRYRSKRVYVLGQVVRPGTLFFQDRMSIVQAIAQAGGFKKAARRNSVIVTRITPKGKKRLVVPVESISEGAAPNFFLAPGDIVFVPESVL